MSRCPSAGAKKIPIWTGFFCRRAGILPEVDSLIDYSCENRHFSPFPAVVALHLQREPRVDSRRDQYNYRRTYPMKSIAVLAASMMLFAVPAAYANPADEQAVTQTPMKMTEAQLDEVVGGNHSPLLNVEIRDINVAIPINAQVAANVLSPDAQITQQLRPGRIRQ
jgi:hypothetical protein